jgi:hypothetical protein
MKQQNILSTICIWFLILFLNVIPSNAQVKFKKFYPAVDYGDQSKMWFNPADSNIYLALQDIVLKIDLYGNVIQRLNMKERFHYPEIAENRVILMHHDGPSPYATRLKTMITDFSLTQKQVAGYQFPLPLGQPNTSIFDDKSYVIQEILYPSAPSSNNSFSFMMKLDSSSQVLWQKSYIGALFTKTVPFKNNQMITTGQTPAGNLAIANLDSLGNVIWAREYSIGVTFANRFQLVNDGDTAITILGHKGNDPQGTFSGKVFMANISSTGKPNWFHLIGDLSFDFSSLTVTQRIKKIPDGGYILLTSVLTNKLSLPAWGQYMAIAKADAKGNILWTRFHGEKGVYVMVSDFMPLPDQGFFASAKVWNPHNWGGYYIIRTDSLGFAGCQEYTDTLPVIYNYPVTDTLLQITATPVNITTYTATMPDTIYPLPVPANGCMLTGLQSTSEGPRSTLSLYPNPAMGKVTVQLPAGQLPEELVVTDGMGRTVRFMRPAPGTQIEIDLTGLPPGLLLVRVITQQGVLSARLVKQ